LHVVAHKVVTFWPISISVGKDKACFFFSLVMSIKYNFFFNNGRVERIVLRHDLIDGHTHKVRQMATHTPKKWQNAKRKKCPYFLCVVIMPKTRESVVTMLQGIVPFLPLVVMVEATFVLQGIGPSFQRW